MTRSPYAYASQDGVSRLLRQQGGLVARVEWPDRAARACVRQQAGVRAPAERAAMQAWRASLIPAAGWSESGAVQPTLTAEIPGRHDRLPGRPAGSTRSSTSSPRDRRGPRLRSSRVLGRELGSVGRRTLLRSGGTAARTVSGPRRVAAGGSLPVISLVVANDLPGRRAEDVVVALQPLLADLLRAPSPSEPGSPTLQPRTIDGVEEAVTLRVSPVAGADVRCLRRQIGRLHEPRGRAPPARRGEVPARPTPSFAPGAARFPGTAVLGSLSRPSPAHGSCRARRPR